MIKLRFLSVFVGILIGLSTLSPSLLADENAEVKALVDSFDQLWIDDQTYAELDMHVKTSNYDRELKMMYWGKGQNKSLVRITFPPKEKGVSTLKSGKDVYNFVPKIARTTKITDALMSQSWMGSHLSNSDLMRSTSIREDYTVSLKQKSGSGPNEIWTLDAFAKPNVATLYRHLLIQFNRKTRMPIEQLVYDKSNNLLRTFHYSDVKNYSGKLVPSRVRVQPETADQKGEFTEVLYTKIDRKIKISEDVFNISSLTEL